MDRDTCNSNDELCPLCEMEPRVPGWRYCLNCRFRGIRFLGIALARAARRLWPEGCVAVVVIALGALIDWWLLLVLAPIAVVAMGRGGRMVYRELCQLVDDWCRGLAPVWEAQRYVSNWQQGHFEGRAAVLDRIRHEAQALGIRLTPSLEAVLSGEQRLDELSDTDVELVRPALEAAERWLRQLADSYDVAADLPYGPDPVC